MAKKKTAKTVKKKQLPASKRAKKPRHSHSLAEHMDGVGLKPKKTRPELPAAPPDPLVTAAIMIARVECKQDSKGCSGPWCGAQGEIRRALEARGVDWKPAPKAEDNGPPVTS